MGNERFGMARLIYRQDMIVVTAMISPTDADFLDLHFYKGSLWRQSSHLDVKLFAKSSNAYLYKTFDS
jgi:hypothetical protein